MAHAPEQGARRGARDGMVTRRTIQRYRDLARGILTPTHDGLQREILLDGLRLLFEARASGTVIDTVAFDDAALDEPAARSLAQDLASAGSEVLIVSRKTLEAMSPVTTPTGAVAIGRRSLVPVGDAFAGASPLVVLAHDVQDPGNVGGIIRTAEAAGATALLAASGTADPFGWKALRGSMGSALRLPIARIQGVDALDACRSAGLTTVALVPRGGEPFYTVDFRRPTAVLLGGEGAGLPSTIFVQADLQVSIPMKAPVESLNVGVAAALVLYEAFRQRSNP